MNFSLHVAPSSEAEIQTEKAQLEKKLSRLTKIRILVWFLAGAVFVLILSSVLNPVFFLFEIPVVAILSKIVMNRIRETTWGIDDRQPLLPEQCPNAIAICTKDKLCEKYRQAVVAAGRMLTRGEFRVMEKWVDESPVRNRVAEHQLACEKLRSIEAL